MRPLYPEIEPYASYRRNTGSLHEIYFEQSGNPRGIPALFVHGGPGSGSSERHRRYFDPTRYRIVNFDQRGCNRSVPAGETRDNTTADLIADMEYIREALHIDKWLLFGGSWGATLSLLYAQRHPERVSAMILRGVFLGRKRDLDWFVRDGANRLLPEAWCTFSGHIPAAERSDLVKAYFDRLQGADREAARDAAVQWARWTGHVVTYLLSTGYEVDPDIQGIIHEARIETHYARNAYFIDEDQILGNASALPDVPVTIMHGRRDLTCTPDASHDLHQAICGSRLEIIEDGGHLASEPAMTSSLVTATDHMAGVLEGGG